MWKIWLLMSVVNSELVRVWLHDIIAKKSSAGRLYLLYVSEQLLITTKVVTDS